jgi:hypothetical protein
MNSNHTPNNKANEFTFVTLKKKTSTHFMCRLIIIIIIIIIITIIISRYNYCLSNFLFFCCLLFVFFLCVCAISVIARMVVVPAH